MKIERGTVWLHGRWGERNREKIRAFTFFVLFRLVVCQSVVVISLRGPSPPLVVAWFSRPKVLATIGRDTGDVTGHIHTASSKRGNVLFSWKPKRRDQPVQIRKETQNYCTKESRGRLLVHAPLFRGPFSCRNITATVLKPLRCIIHLSRKNSGGPVSRVLHLCNTASPLFIFSVYSSLSFSIIFLHSLGVYRLP